MPLRFPKFQFGGGLSPVRGFAYTPDGQPDAFTNAEPGSVVRLPERKPPWLVVVHDLDRVLVTHWPGRLLKIEIIDAVTPRDEQRNGGSPPLPDAGYTRAVVAKVLEELPATRLFGDHGDDVAAVAEKASRLTLSDAFAMQAARRAEASACTSRVWTAWMAQMGYGTDHIDNCWDGVLGAGPRGNSPVGKGLYVIHRILKDRAIRLCGEDVLLFDDDENYYGLQQPWDDTELCLLEAALALGAPGLTGGDRDILLSGWRVLDR